MNQLAQPPREPNKRPAARTVPLLCPPSSPWECRGAQPAQGTWPTTLPSRNLPTQPVRTRLTQKCGDLALRDPLKPPRSTFPYPHRSNTVCPRQAATFLAPAAGPPRTHTLGRSVSVRRCLLLRSPTGETRSALGPVQRRALADPPAPPCSRHPPGTQGSDRDPVEQGPDPRSSVPSATSSLPASRGHAKQGGAVTARLSHRRPRPLRGSSPSPDLHLLPGGKSPGEKQTRGVSQARSRCMRKPPGPRPANSSASTLRGTGPGGG